MYMSYLLWLIMTDYNARDIYTAVVYNTYIVVYYTIYRVESLYYFHCI